MAKIAKTLISPFLFKTSLVGFFIFVFSLLPQSILAEILSVTDTIQISAGEEVSGRVAVSSPEDGSCLKAMSAQGLLPTGVTVDFTPECGEGDWVSNYQMKADNTAEPGTYPIGFVEIPKAGPPAVDVKQLRLVVIAVSPEPSPTAIPTTPPATTMETPVTSPPTEGGRSFPRSFLLISLGSFLMILLVRFLLKRLGEKPTLLRVPTDEPLLGPDPEGHLWPPPPSGPTPPPEISPEMRALLREYEKLAEEEMKMRFIFKNKGKYYGPKGGGTEYFEDLANSPDSGFGFDKAGGIKPDEPDSIVYEDWLKRVYEPKKKELDKKLDELLKKEKLK